MEGTARFEHQLELLCVCTYIHTIWKPLQIAADFGKQFSVLNSKVKNEYFLECTFDSLHFFSLESYT